MSPASDATSPDPLTGPSVPERTPVPVLYTAAAIQCRVRALAAELSRDLAGLEPLLVCVLHGARTFFADLTRGLSIPVQRDALRVGSYGDATHSVGEVELLQDVCAQVRDRHVVVVEDIVDTGASLAFVREHLLARRPARLWTCALLDKPSRRKVVVPVEYVGFTIDDAFVVGYGLDLAGQYRDLPYIGLVEG